MIIYFYLFVLLNLNYAEPSSIRSRTVKNDLVPFLGSKAELAKKDAGSLKIISNEPFIIQLGTTAEPDKRKRKEDDRKDKDKKEDVKRRKTASKRAPKLKSTRRRHRIRRDVHHPFLPLTANHHEEKLENVKEKEETVTTEDMPLQRILTLQPNEPKGTRRENSIDREQIFRAIDEALKMETKKAKDEEEEEEKKKKEDALSLDQIASDEDSAEEGFKEWLKKRGGITPKKIPRTRKALAEPAPVVGMANPRTLKTPRHSPFLPSKPLTSSLGRLDRKLNNIKKLFGSNGHGGSGEPDSGIRVRRKTDADRSANKIAKMFLTLSAMNGYHDRRKPKCKEDDYDDDEYDWNDEDDDGRAIPVKRTPSSNEERYKVKKWIEYLKSRRSNRYCPCNQQFSGDDDGFPLENKVGKGPLMIDGEHSGEDSSEFDAGRRDKPYHQRYAYHPVHGRAGGRGDSYGRYRYPKINADVDEKLKALRERGRRKLDLPLEDLELYRSRAKKILQNAEDILDKIKEEENKRITKPEYLMNHLKELTSRIQSNPRNNENNEFMRILQKNLGFDSLHRVYPDDGRDGTFPDAMDRRHPVDPYGKAHELEDGARQLSAYLLRNLAKLGEGENKVSEEREMVDEGTQTDDASPSAQRVVSDSEDYDAVDGKSDKDVTDVNFGDDKPKSEENGKENPTINKDIEGPLKRIIQDLMKDKKEQSERGLQKNQKTVELPKKHFNPIRPIANSKKDPMEKIKSDLKRTRIPPRRKLGGSGSSSSSSKEGAEGDHEYEYDYDSYDVKQTPDSKNAQFAGSAGVPFVPDEKELQEGEAELAQESQSNENFQPINAAYAAKPDRKTHPTGSEKPGVKNVDRLVEKIMADLKDVTRGNEETGRDVDRIVGKLMSDLTKTADATSKHSEDAADGNTAEYLSSRETANRKPKPDGIGEYTGKGMEINAGRRTPEELLSDLLDPDRVGASAHGNVNEKIIEKLENAMAALNAEDGGGGKDVPKLMRKLTQDLRGLSNGPAKPDKKANDVVEQILNKINEATRVAMSADGKKHKTIKEGMPLKATGRKSDNMPGQIGEKSKPSKESGHDVSAMLEGILKDLKAKAQMPTDSKDAASQSGGRDDTRGNILGNIMADKKLTTSGQDGTQGGARGAIEKILQDLMAVRARGAEKTTGSDEGNLVGHIIGKLNEASQKMATVESGRNAVKGIENIMQDLNEGNLGMEKLGKESDGTVEQIIGRLSDATKEIRSDDCENDQKVVGKLMEDLKRLAEREDGTRGKQLVGRVLEKLKDATQGLVENGVGGRKSGAVGDPTTATGISHGDEINDMLEKIVSDPQYSTKASGGIDRDAVGKIIEQLEETTKGMTNEKGKNAYKAIAKLMHDLKDLTKGKEPTDDSVDRMVGQILEKLKDTTNEPGTDGGVDAHETLSKIIADFKQATKRGGERTGNAVEVPESESRNEIDGLVGRIADNLEKAIQEDKRQGVAGQTVGETYSKTGSGTRDGDDVMSPTPKDIDRVVGRIMGGAVPKKEIKNDEVEGLLNTADAYDGDTRQTTGDDIESSSDVVSAIKDEENAIDGMLKSRLADEYDGPMTQYNKMMTSSNEVMDKVVGRIIGDARDGYQYKKADEELPYDQEDTGIDTVDNNPTANTPNDYDVAEADQNVQAMQQARLEETADFKENEDVDVEPSSGTMSEDQMLNSPRTNVPNMASEKDETDAYETEKDVIRGERLGMNEEDLDNEDVAAIARHPSDESSERLEVENKKGSEPSGNEPEIKSQVKMMEEENGNAISGEENIQLMREEVKDEEGDNQVRNYENPDASYQDERVQQTRKGQVPASGLPGENNGNESTEDVKQDLANLDEVQMMPKIPSASQDETDGRLDDTDNSQESYIPRKNTEEERVGESNTNVDSGEHETSPKDDETKETVRKINRQNLNSEEDVTDVPTNIGQFDKVRKMLDDNLREEQMRNNQSQDDENVQGVKDEDGKYRYGAPGNDGIPEDTEEGEKVRKAFEGSSQSGEDSREKELKSTNDEIRESLNSNEEVEMRKNENGEFGKSNEDYESSLETEAVQATPRNGMYDMDGNYLNPDDEEDEQIDVTPTEDTVASTRKDEVDEYNQDVSAYVDKTNKMEEESPTPSGDEKYAERDNNNNNDRNSSEDERVQIAADKQDSGLISSKESENQQQDSNEIIAGTQVVQQPKSNEVMDPESDTDSFGEDPGIEQALHYFTRPDSYDLKKEVNQDEGDAPTNDVGDVLGVGQTQVDDEIVATTDPNDQYDNYRLGSQTGETKMDDNGNDSTEMDAEAKNEKVEIAEEIPTERGEYYGQRTTDEDSAETVQRTNDNQENVDSVEMGGTPNENSDSLNREGDEVITDTGDEETTGSTNDNRYSQDQAEENVQNAMEAAVATNEEEDFRVTTAENENVQKTAGETNQLNRYDNEGYQNAANEDERVGSPANQGNYLSSQEEKSEGWDEADGRGQHEQTTKQEDDQQDSMETKLHQNDVNRELSKVRKMMDDEERTTATEVGSYEQDEDKDTVALTKDDRVSTTTNGDDELVPSENEQDDSNVSKEKVGLSPDEVYEHEQTTDDGDDDDSGNLELTNKEKMTSRKNNELDDEIESEKVQTMNEADNVDSPRSETEDEEKENDVNFEMERVEKMADKERERPSGEEIEEGDNDETITDATAETEKEKSQERYEETVGNSGTVQKTFDNLKKLTPTDETESQEDNEVNTDQTAEGTIINEDDEKVASYKDSDDSEVTSASARGQNDSSENDPGSDEERVEMQTTRQQDLGEETTRYESPSEEISDSNENDVLASNHLRETQQKDDLSGEEQSEPAEINAVEDAMGEESNEKVRLSDENLDRTNSEPDGLVQKFQPGQTLDGSEMDETTEREMTEDKATHPDFVHSVGDRQSEPENLEKLTTYDRGDVPVEKSLENEGASHEDVTSDPSKDWAINSSNEKEIGKDDDDVVESPEEERLMNPKPKETSSENTKGQEEEDDGDDDEELTKLKQMKMMDEREMGEISNDPNDWKIQVVDDEGTGNRYDDDDDVDFDKMSKSEPADLGSAKEIIPWRKHPYEDGTIPDYDDPLLAAQNPPADYELLDNSKELYPPLQVMKSKTLGSFDDNGLQNVDHRAKSKALTMPKEIHQIMKDLNEGMSKEDINSLQSLDADKINKYIERIDEAEMQSLNQNDEVDCKECACAEEIESRSRKIGRYEIVKDFLHWVKDLRMNRVLGDD